MKKASYDIDRIVRGKKVYLFSNSIFSAHFACPRKFHIQYIQHVYMRMKSPALDMGSAFHAGVEAGYNDESVKRAVGSHYKSVIEKAPDNATKQHTLIDRCKAYAMANGYIQKYLRRDRDRFDEILVEQDFEFKLAEGDDYILNYKGTLDGLFHDSEGYWVVEHKTTADPSEAYRARLPFNGQVLGYAIGCKKITGEWPRGCIYNMVKKTKISRKIAESLPAFLHRVSNEYVEFADKKNYFIRDEFFYAGRNIKTWRKQAKIHALQLYEMLQHQDDMNLWMQNTNACLDYRACPMLNICKTGHVNDMLYEFVEHPQKLGGGKRKRR